MAGQAASSTAPFGSVCEPQRRGSQVIQIAVLVERPSSARVPSSGQSVGLTAQEDKQP